MARVVYGLGITAIKGSVGSVTFQENRSGSILRSRPRAYKRYHSKQSESIQNFYALKPLWQKLTQANIDLWNAFGAAFDKTSFFGSVKTLSGINWFCTVNYYRSLFGLSVLDTPPTYESGISIPAFTFLVKRDCLVLDFDTSWGTVADNLLIYTSYPVSNKIAYTRSPLRLTKIVPAGPFVSYDLTDLWETAHSLSFPPGQVHPQFYISIALRTSKNVSCIMGPGAFGITRFDDVLGGIGSMIIGSTFVVA